MQTSAAPSAAHLQYKLTFGLICFLYAGKAIFGPFFTIFLVKRPVRRTNWHGNWY